MLVACSQEQISKNEFHVSGKFDNLQDSSIVRLFKFNGNVGMSVASDTISASDNTFALIDTAANNELARYSIQIITLEAIRNQDYNSSKNRDIYGNGGLNITVSGDYNDYYNWTINSKVPEQKTSDYLFNSTQKNNDELQIALDTILTKIRNAQMANDQETFDKAREEYDKALIETNFKYSIKILGLISQLDKIDLAAFNSIPTYSEAKSDSTLFDLYNSVYNKLTDEQKETATGRKINKMLGNNTILNIGDKITNATIYDFDGNKHQLYDLLTKPLLIDFWSVGCGPCHQVVPILKEMAADSTINANIISITIDGDAMWKMGTDMLKLESSHNFTDKFEDSGLYADFNAGGMPFFVVVDTDGTIKFTCLGFDQETILKTLKELQK
ncbi:MAG: TlpA family protein disulfide reductase [Bacteroidales bacterium]|nr:TlpA family protein disulfide reductase [Bacteroidales bacterium]